MSRPPIIPLKPIPIKDRVSMIFLYYGETEPLPMKRELKGIYGFSNLKVTVDVTEPLPLNLNTQRGQAA